MKSKKGSTGKLLPISKQPEEAKNSKPDDDDVYDFFYSDKERKENSSSILAFIFYYLILILVLSLFQVADSYAQTATSLQTIKGHITDERGTGLAGALIRIKGSTLGTSSGKDGSFEIRNMPVEITLLVSYIGYKTKEITVRTEQPLQVSLEPDVTQLKEVSVLHTGYQEVPKERATGSFVHIDQALFNRRISTDILSKLDGVASGIYFNNSGGMLNSNYTLPNNYESTNPANKLGINIRGQSTLSNQVSKDPLIVVDNFPYEGDINNLNPEMVESVSVLKDAAAASIWGARAGNGVIVITTKKGKFQQKMKIDLTVNSTVGKRPDVYADKSFLNAASYISVEDSLYKGYLTNDIANTLLYPALSPAVLVWEDLRKGNVSQAEADQKIAVYKQQDIRADINKYIYQPSLNQQYALTARGGADRVSYAISLGYDKIKTNLKRNGYDRFSLNSYNTYKPLKNLELTAGVIYAQLQMKSNNAYQWGSSNYYMGGSSYAGMYPYAQLTGENGGHLSIAKKLNQNYVDSVRTLGLLDWNYSPLDELEAANNANKQYNLVLKAGTKYTFASFLNAELNFQNERQTQTISNYYSVNSWYARDLINQFTQVDPATGTLTYPVPKNGILNLANDESITNSLRGQLNYNQVFNAKHAINAFLGTEVRQTRRTGYLRTSYGYDEVHSNAVNSLDYVTYFTMNAGYGGSIPAPSGDFSGSVNRYLSYYANGAYTYANRYTLTASARKDGSNIFGVNTNQKFAPLWSSGLAWNISQEPFYHSGFLPVLKIRGTYGFNGNVYNGSAYITGKYYTSSLTRLPYLSGITAPNPELRWEKVRNVNLGIDFETSNNRLNGTIEVYEKKGTDLIDNIPLFASSGFSSFMGNAASTKTSGIDLTLTSRILSKQLMWNVSFLMSTMSDKVLEYNAVQTSGSIQTNAVALKGKPLYGVYSYKWAGLNPVNGNPQGYLNGMVSEDYVGIMNNFNPDSLLFHGSARPTVSCSFRNDFSFKGISLSLNIIYKGGYYFRRSSTSLNYMDIIYSGGHADYDQRWQKSGDEDFTQVPSLVYETDVYRNNFYTYSAQLVEKADHIRLQDIRLGYQFPKQAKVPFNQFQVFMYANNLGIIWRKNDLQLDPDAQGASLPNPQTLSFGIRIGF